MYSLICEPSALHHVNHYLFLNKITEKDMKFANYTHSCILTWELGMIIIWPGKKKKIIIIEELKKIRSFLHSKIKHKCEKKMCVRRKYVVDSLPTIYTNDVYWKIKYNFSQSSDKYNFIFHEKSFVC